MVGFILFYALYQADEFLSLPLAPQPSIVDNTSPKQLIKLSTIAVFGEAWNADSGVFSCKWPPPFRIDEPILRKGPPLARSSGSSDISSVCSPSHLFCRLVPCPICLQDPLFRSSVDPLSTLFLTLFSTL